MIKIYTTVGCSPKLNEQTFKQLNISLRGFGPDVVSVDGPIEISPLNLFCSGIHLYILFSPYLCFI